jgi:hypothetical protein
LRGLEREAVLLVEAPEGLFGSLLPVDIRAGAEPAQDMA